MEATGQSFVTAEELITEVFASFLSMSSNKECPTCRKKLVSKRSLRPDPNFDALISKIYPSRDEYEAHQERVLARISKHNNQQALSHSIEEGLKIQAMNRYIIMLFAFRLKIQCLSACPVELENLLLWYLAKQFLTFGKRIFNLLSTIRNLCIAPCNFCGSLLETSA